MRFEAVPAAAHRELTHLSLEYRVPVQLVAYAMHQLPQLRTLELGHPMKRLGTVHDVVNNNERCSIADPYSGWVKTKKSMMKTLEHISKSLETFFWVKILKFIDPDPGTFLTLYPAAGIRDRKNSDPVKYPGSATLER